MTIIINPPQIEAIDDYCIWKGTLDAIRDTYSETLFSFNSKVAAELRALYETAYLMELESGAFESECQFEVEGIIHTYDDTTGWGKLYSDQFIGLLDFDYRIVQGEDLVGQGDHVQIRFKKEEEGIKPISVKHLVT